MVTLILIVVVFILFDIVSLLWGYDSRDGIDSIEWVRRQEWLFLHSVQRD